VWGVGGRTRVVVGSMGGGWCGTCAPVVQRGNEY